MLSKTYLCKQFVWMFNGSLNITRATGYFASEHNIRLITLAHVIHLSSESKSLYIDLSNSSHYIFYIYISVEISSTFALDGFREQRRKVVLISTVFLLFFVFFYGARDVISSFRISISLPLHECAPLFSWILQFMSFYGESTRMQT